MFNLPPLEPDPLQRPSLPPDHPSSYPPPLSPFDLASPLPPQKDTSFDPSATQQKKRRNRPHRSCEGCRARKQKCSREAVCTNCKLRDVECVYKDCEPLPASTTSPSIPVNGESSEDSSSSIISQLSHDLCAARLEIDHLRLVNSQLAAALRTYRSPTPPQQEPPTPLSPGFPPAAGPSYSTAPQPNYPPFQPPQVVESYHSPPQPPPMSLSFLPFPPPPPFPPLPAPTSGDFLPPPPHSQPRLPQQQQQQTMHLRTATSFSTFVRGGGQGEGRVEWAGQAHGRTASWP